MSDWIRTQKGGPVIGPELAGAADPRWYGARGDGVTDDTAAFRRALDEHVNVLVPPGTHRITGPLQLTQNRHQIVGASKRAWLLKDGDFNLLEVTGLRCEVRSLSLFGQSGGSNQILTLTGAQMFLVDDVTIAGHGVGNVFNPAINDTGIAFDGCTYGRFRDVRVLNCRTGITDLGGGNGGIRFVGCDVHENDVGVDLAGPSNSFAGGTIAHNKTAEAKIGTRLASSSGVPDRLRGACDFHGVHWETNNDGVGPMIVVGDAGSATIANDVPAVRVLGGFLALNSTQRNFIQFNAGRGASIVLLEVHGAHAANSGLIKTTTANALRPLVIGVEFPSGAVIPALDLFAPGKGDLVLQSDGNQFLVSSSKLLLRNTNNAVSSADTFRVFTRNAAGADTERLMVGCGADFVTTRIKDFLELPPVAAANVPNSRLFVDAADNKLKFRDAAGVVQLLY